MVWLGRLVGGVALGLSTECWGAGHGSRWDKAEETVQAAGNGDGLMGGTMA